MITTTFPTKPVTRIDYCPVTRRVKMVKLRGVLLYDKYYDSLIKRLVNFVENEGLNIDYGSGVPAFVRELSNTGYLQIIKG
jgi:hypothetical protein